MKIGTEQVKHKILRSLKRHGAAFKGIKYGDFADELSAEIIELLGDDDMNQDMLTQARAKGIPDKLSLFSERVARALRLSMMPLDPISIESYQWIMEQETKGQTIEKFAEWARAEDGGKYMLKYRKGAGIIVNDWGRAFENSGIVMLAGEERI